MPFFVPSVYRHNQTTAADTWTITHNIGNNGSQGLPIVDVYINVDGQDQKILPASVVRVDKDTCVLTFAQPRSGWAVVIV